MFDITKSYKTRDGRAARVVSTNYNGKKAQFSLLTIITERNGNESIATHTVGGIFYNPTVKHQNDLVNKTVVSKALKYLNLYSKNSDDVWGFYYDTKEEAEKSADVSSEAIFIAKPIEVILRDNPAEEKG